MTVDTEKVLWEADGSRMERCSPRVCASKPDGECREEPEEHKRNEETANIQARSFMARALEVNGQARQAEGEAKVV